MTFEIYQDAKGEFRWRLRAANGEIVGDSGEGYKQKEMLTAELGKITDSIATGNFEITFKR